MATYYCPAVVQGSPLDFNEVAVLFAWCEQDFQKQNQTRKHRIEKTTKN